jgi:hypothetical protein
MGKKKSGSTKNSSRAAAVPSAAVPEFTPTETTKTLFDWTSSDPSVSLESAAIKIDEGHARSLLPGEEIRLGLQALRVKYASVNKAEWWWIFDDTLLAIAGQLERENYVVLDDFLLPDACSSLANEVISAYDAGKLNDKVRSSSKSQISISTSN